MKSDTKVWGWCAFWIAFMCMMLIVPAYAGGDRISQSNDMNNQTAGDVKIKQGTSVDVGNHVEVGGVNVPVTTGSVTQGSVSGGDVTVGGDSNRAYALSNSLGDVDIAGCLGSTQWNTPIFGKQKLVLNWPCMAEFYLRNGMYENAAMAICNTEIRQEFDSEESCRAAHNFKPMAVPALMIEPAEDEDEEDDHKKYEAEIAALAARLKASEEKARKATLEARYAVQQAQAHSEQAQYGLSDDQVAELEQWDAKWGKK